MKTTRILALVLALVFATMLAPIGAGAENFSAEGYPICPGEKVTLRVMIQTRAEMPSDLNEQYVQQKAEEIMNVHIEWIQVPADAWEEKKNLMLATQAGLGNGETSIFPVQIFKVKEGINYNPDANRNSYGEVDDERAMIRRS